MMYIDIGKLESLGGHLTGRLGEPREGSLNFRYSLGE